MEIIKKNITVVLSHTNDKGATRVKGVSDDN